MAGMAVCPQLGFMNIIIGMACIAFRRGLNVVWREMAFVTLCCRVHADQWKPCLIVIKGGVTVPAFFVMAIVAFFPLFAFMCIIIFVAVETFGR